MQTVQTVHENMRNGDNQLSMLKVTCIVSVRDDNVLKVTFLLFISDYYKLFTFITASANEYLTLIARKSTLDVRI